MRETKVDKYNIGHILHGLFNQVETVSDKKRYSKRAEYFLRCGGGLDTESTTITDDDGKPLYAFLYHIQLCINNHYYYMRDIDLVPQFFNELCAEVRSKKDGKKQPVLILWVANLGHEWAFLKKQFAQVGISDLFAKDDRTPLKIVLQGVVELRECIGLFGSSLAKIAKDYTATQKLVGDLDYSLIRTAETTLTDDEYAYCKNDVVILDELAEVAFKKFTDKGLKIPMTSTGILRQKCKNAIKNVRFEYRDNEKLMPQSEYDYYLMRRYMFSGGLSGTSPIYVGKHIKRCKCADITSDYPAQINHKLYPAGELHECPPEEIHTHRGQFKILLFSCDLRPKTKHAVISKEKILNFPKSAEQYVSDDSPIKIPCSSCVVVNGKLLFGDNVCMLLNDVDLRALSELYHFANVKIYRSWYFTCKAFAPRFLRDTMNKDYMTKQSLKATGQSDTIMYKEAKSAVNSYYGMTAQKLYDCLYTYDKLPDIDDYDITSTAAELSYAQKRERMWLSPYIGYWCTSYARAILMHYIAKYPDMILQYDTDSLYYITDTDIISAERIAEFENDLQRYNRVLAQQNNEIFKGDKHFEDLGAWEIDKDDYIGFKGLGAKRYLLQKPDGSLKPVVAGMVKSSFIDYINETGLNPFEVFRNDLTLSRVRSKKLASQYFDNRENETIIKKVTDYQDNEALVPIYTYHALYDIEFSMYVAAAYEELCENIAVEKGFPEQYREYEKYLNEVKKHVN